MMEFALKARNCVSKTKHCIKNEEFWIQNDEFCSHRPETAAELAYARTFAERTHDNAVSLMAAIVAAGNGSYVLMPNCFTHNFALKGAFSEVTAANWTAADALAAFMVRI